MHFGYFTLTDTPPAYGAGRRNPQQFLREVLQEALLAEELGFNSVWVPEHHFGLFGCLPTPAVFLAHVAAKTTRIKLDVHFISSLPVILRSACKAWVDREPVQIVAAED